ncbi:26293_t:CDS:2, partial [Racocetra persica]
PKPSSVRTTVYKKTGNTYSLKIKTSRLIFNEISQKFGTFPFPLRALEDEKKARLGDFVAQFFNTVLLTKNGSIKITNTFYDPEIIQSDKKVEDEEIVSLLATNAAEEKKDETETADE